MINMCKCCIPFHLQAGKTGQDGYFSFLWNPNTSRFFLGLTLTAWLHHIFCSIIYTDEAGFTFGYIVWKSRKTEVVVHPREIYITRLKHFSFKVGLLPAIWNISDLLYITFLKHQDFPGSLETVPLKDILTNPAFSYG